MRIILRNLHYENFRQDWAVNKTKASKNKYYFGKEIKLDKIYQLIPLIKLFLT